MLLSLNARCRGFEHIKADKPVQDSAFSGSDNSAFTSTDNFVFSGPAKNFAYAFVADGHGGEKYIRSDKGSQLACFSAANIIANLKKDFLAEVKRLSNEPVRRKRLVEENLKLICSKLCLDWKNRVKQNFVSNPLTEDELKLCENAKLLLPIPDDDIPVLYGSTLLLTFYFEQLNFWFALQIGDGKCVAINKENECFYPIEDDEEQGFGVTKSLCSKNAADDFRFGYGFEPISSIFVMSDGMTDSFDSEKLPAFLLNIQNNALNDIENTQKELESFLPTLSEQGSGDDISIAAIFHKENEGNLFNKILNKK